MKEIVLNDRQKYIIKDPRIKQFLLQIRNSGKQSFLLTNSEYFYTNVGALFLKKKNLFKFIEIFFKKLFFTYYLKNLKISFFVYYFRNEK